MLRWPRVPRAARVGDAPSSHRAGWVMFEWLPLALSVAQPLAELLQDACDARDSAIAQRPAAVPPPHLDPARRDDSRTSVYASDSAPDSRDV